MIVKHLIFLVGFVAGVMATSGRDLCYSGNGSTGWDLDNTRSCWTDRSSGYRTFYADGDNLLVDDTLTINGVRVMTQASAWIGANIMPGDLEFNIADTFTVTSGGYNFFGARRIVKNGAGTLTWSFSASNTDCTTPVEINQGMLICANANGYAGYVPVRNDALREYVINEGGELRVTARNCFGKCDLYTIAGAGGGCVRIKKGGKFSLYVPDQSAHCSSSVWDLYLEGGTIDLLAKGANDSLGLLLINHKLSVLGDTACVISNTPGYTCQELAINKLTPTTFDISDVTGDAAPDLTLDIPLTQAVDGTPQFVKQGAGTLLLLKQNSLFASDVIVKEGVLSLDYHPGLTEFGSNKGSTTVLGNMRTDGRTITIRDDGCLELKQRNLFTSYGSGEDGGNQITTELVVSDGGTVTVYGGANLGPLTVSDGNISFFDDVDYGWGAISVRGTMKVRGTKPFTLERHGTKGRCRQILYRSYATVFDVADITGDATADFIDELPFVMPDYSDYNTDPETGEKYPYGFVKNGSGTMVVKGDSHSDTLGMNGEARVVEGTLQVDGHLGRSSAVVVSAGAYLAGTGTVNAVQVAAAGGFRAAAGQHEPLKLLGGMTIGANPVIRIDNVDGVAEDKVKAVLFSAAGTVVGMENLNDAVVYLDDAVWQQGRYRIMCDNGTLSVKGVKGMKVVVR